MFSDLILKISVELRKLSVSEDDIEFIISKIHVSDKDQNFYKTDKGLDRILHDRNPRLVDLFHKASKNGGIIWEHEMPNDYNSYF